MHTHTYIHTHTYTHMHTRTRTRVQAYLLPYLLALPYFILPDLTLPFLTLHYLISQTCFSLERANIQPVQPVLAWDGKS